MNNASCSAARGRTAPRGFTLIELAMMLLIVGLVLGGMLMTLSAQMEQSNRSETQRRLETAKELLLAYAIVNGRLPCPAVLTSNGDEAPSGGGACTNYLNGFLPARAIGFQPTDSFGFAIDAWGNRLRYAVAQEATSPDGSSGCGSPASPAFTNASNLKASTNGIACAPKNIVVCDAVQNTNPGPIPGTSLPSCGTWSAEGDAREVTNRKTVVAVVFSTGKNTQTVCGTCADEAANTDNNGVFVYHDPRPAGAQGGEYDDQMAWIPIGMLYSKLIAGGKLP